ncbi:MAG: 30S ribosomal protein S20 [Deltaproteobacteria bacterium]|nr:30S ribosomal protein S20 [Deltaproteobacteria bacterium]
MPQHKSAAKRMRQNKKRYMRNKAYRTRLKNVIRTVREKIEDKNLEEAQKAFKQAEKTINHIASKGVIHKNKASRLTSKLAKAIHKLSSETSSA